MDERMETLIKRARQYAEEGAVVTVKIDGERILAGIPTIYTVVISGGKLSREDFYRCDGEDIADLVQGALDHYSATRNRSLS
jgi:uncharacterized Zn finger protein